MDSKQFKEAATSAIDEIVNYYDTIEDRRVVSNVEPGYLKKLLPDGPPHDGESWADIQKDIETKIMPGLTHWLVEFCPVRTPANSQGNPLILWPSFLRPPHSLACLENFILQHLLLQHSIGYVLLL
jgi:hypothetical protein